MEATMHNKYRLLAGAAFLVSGIIMSTPQAHAASGIKVGVLSCHVDSGWGFIFGSSRDLRCTYGPVAKGAETEYYSGKISKFGVDIGYIPRVV